MIVITFHKDTFNNNVIGQRVNEWHFQATGGVHKTALECGKVHPILVFSREESFDNCVRREDWWSIQRLNGDGKLTIEDNHARVWFANSAKRTARL